MTNKKKIIRPEKIWTFFFLGEIPTPGKCEGWPMEAIKWQSCFRYDFVDKNNGDDVEKNNLVSESQRLQRQNISFVLFFGVEWLNNGLLTKCVWV